VPEREASNLTAASKPGFFYGYFIALICFFIMLLAFGTFYGFGVFFKPLATDFGWSRTVTSGAYSLAAFLSGLLAIGMGRLTDRFGPRIVMTFCGFLLGMGYLLMSQVSTVWQLYLF
jgi:MFS family permease